MKSITSWLNESAYIKPLSPGCIQCASGSKMVLLITGKCSSACYYCPLSQKKMGKDVIYADEWQLHNEQDTNSIIEEAKSIAAKGAGITGGDPLFVWQRTHDYIQLLKNEFGDTFHIHLYTSGLENANKIPDLAKIGLDEIRFHPPLTQWTHLHQSKIEKSITISQNESLDVAIEIPVIPHYENEIQSLIKFANSKKLQWINLNELEFSEQNAQILLQRGYHVKNELSAAVYGSQETAINILQHMQPLNLDVGIHYCSVSFKDGIQLRNRIKRRATHTAKPYHEITEDGTLLYGIIHTKSKSLETLVNELKTTFKIPPQMFEVNTLRKRIDLAGWILEDIASELTQQGYTCYIIEEYPTADHLEIERIPLPSN
jgi:pyruvate formate-lyase activating enzyme-like uncharacterized protein